MINNKICYQIKKIQFNSWLRQIHAQKLKGKGAKLATVNFQMDNFSTPKLDGAKPYIVNKNGTNLASPLT